MGRREEGREGGKGVQCLRFGGACVYKKWSGSTGRTNEGDEKSGKGK